MKWGDGEPWWVIPDRLGLDPQVTKPGSFLAVIVTWAIAAALLYAAVRLGRSPSTPPTVVVAR